MLETKDDQDEQDEDSSTDSEIIKDALELFRLSAEHEEENRRLALEDVKFSKLSEQWDDADVEQRKLERRPCLTINRLPSYIRKVVNSARQSNLEIKVHPVDSKGDPKTAEIIGGLIKNIQYTSDASIAYDTGLDAAVSGGFGYWRVSIDYAHDDSFDLDLKIDRIINQFSVYGDHNSTTADSSDWNYCFVIDSMSKDDFEEKYGKHKQTNWEGEEYNKLSSDWMDGDCITVAEYWKREIELKIVLLLSDGTVVDQAIYDDAVDIFEMQGIKPVDKREISSYKVCQRIITGAEVLETNEWRGRYIPIIPVYGEEICIEGKRYFKSLIRDAKDPQRMLNYWRTASTELVALAPKAPFIGPKGAFNTAIKKWNTTNTKSHAFIEYDGNIPPQRQPFDGPPAGALQEAINAADDIKSVLGLFDAAMGARSNEVSGLAINARKSEGDVSTYHFIDNLSRAIAHTGRVLIDLIPHVYNGNRIIRILGGRTGKEPENVPLNQPVDVNGMQCIYDLSVGKYDLTVDVGPSSQTQREETINQMMELLRAFPDAAPLVGDLVAENLDIIGADEIAKRMKSMLPPQLKDEGGDPALAQIEQIKQQAQAAMHQLQLQLSQATQKINELQADKAIDVRKNDIDAYNAETNRLKVTAPALGSNEIQALVIQTMQQLMQSPDILPGNPAQAGPIQ